MPRSLGFIALLVAFTACWDDDSDGPNFPIQEAQGYRPIYVSASDAHAKDITLEAPRDLTSPGKIYVIGKYLLVNDGRYGVHVYDNTDPAKPVQLGFIVILGNTDVAVRQNILYANNLADLIAVDFHDLDNLKEISRFRQQYWSIKLPPVSDTYFECVDTTKGVVLGWQKEILKSPKCYR